MSTTIKKGPEVLKRIAEELTSADCALAPCSAFPTDVLSVRASKIADEIFAIFSDTTRGDLSNHQLATAVISRELRKTPNDKITHSREKGSQ